MAQDFLIICIYIFTFLKWIIIGTTCFIVIQTFFYKVFRINIYKKFIKLLEK